MNCSRRPTQSETNLLTEEQARKTRINNQVFYSAAFLTSKTAHLRSASVLRRSISDSVERNVCRRTGLHQACKEGIVDVVTKLVEKSRSTFDNLDASGYAPLHYAARYERTQIARLLIDHGADLSVSTSGDLRLATPLHLAARFNAISVARMLIEEGADVSKRSAFGQQALHYAARRGSIQLVKLFLEEGCVSPQVTDNEGATPLHVACQSGRLDIVQLLLKYGGNPCQADCDGCTAIHFAAKEGRADILRILLTTVPIKGMPYSDILNTVDKHTTSCLHLAVQHGHVEAAKECIKHGADTSAIQEDMNTPLHVACSNCDYEMVLLLVTHGAMLDAEDAQGMTPILRASLAGHVQIIDHLLNEGVDIASLPGSGSPSPLLCAVKRGHHNAVTQLLKRGSPIDLRDISERTSLHIAVYSADTKTICVLLENGGTCLLNTRDRDGKTPMHYAAAKGDIKVIDLLLKAGSRVDLKDEEERIPLHYAAENGNLFCVQALVDSLPLSIDDNDARLCTPLNYAAAGAYISVVRYLLDKGAEIDNREDDRVTPLIHVSKIGCPLTAKVLLDHGAKIDTTDKNRNTALTTAAAFGNTSLVTLLLDQGADVTIVTTTGQNCLTAAITAGHKNVCMAIVKHERWEEACKYEDRDGFSPVKYLIERFPDVAKVVMSKCITSSDHQENDENLQVTYNFKYLDPPPYPKTVSIGKKFFAPKIMVQGGRKDLLFHPLTLELIRYKWKMFGLRFFYLAAFLHLIFIVVYTFYILCENEMYWVDQLKAHNYTTDTHSSTPLCYRETLIVAQVIIGLIAIFNLCIEGYQMYAERWDYIDTSNVVELATFSFSIVAIILRISDSITAYWTFTVIAVLLAYLTMLIQLQSLFQSGIYVTMLFEVLKTLVRVMMVFVILFFAYALVFHLLLSRNSNKRFQGLKTTTDSKRDPFSTIELSFIKVMVMTIGEIEYTRFFVDQPLVLPVLSRLVFLSFCIILPIVLMNLTIGLAVGDIDSIQKNAELKRLTIQIDSIYEFEEKLPCWLYRRFYKSTIVKKPNERARTFKQKIKCRLSSNLLSTTDKAPEGFDLSGWMDVADNLNNKIQAQEERMEMLTTELKLQRNVLEKILCTITGTADVNDQ